MRIQPFKPTSLQALIQGYDAWATTYDRDVREMGYCTPAHVAEAVCRLIANRDALLLDVGVGTGLLGEALYRRGYRNLAGMDASHGMLKQAARKGIYRLLCEMKLGASLGYAHRSFDGLIAAGVFSSGYVPSEALTALDPIVRSGGWVVFSLKWDGNIKEPFLAEIRRLEKMGRWQALTASAVYTSWAHTDPGILARVLVYRVL
jgi:predicted TPR repeat methyltransferase